MGMTLTTLSLYNANRLFIIPMLASTDLLRDQNYPWLTVVPAHEPFEDSFQRLSKMARQLTKDSEAVALLFYYFDDEMFLCSFYKKGRRRTSCENNQSWAKLGKKISECLGDDFSSKAFRYVSHCINLGEQLQLLEETLGTALYDFQEAEPRVVKRCDTTLRAIKARDALLRKRPNRFMITELPFSEWPDEERYHQKLLSLLRPQWREYNLYNLLCERDMKQYMAPNSKSFITYHYCVDGSFERCGVFLMDGKTEECWELKRFPGSIKRAVWQTENGGTVVIHTRTLIQNPEEAIPRKQFWDSVICLNRDGSEQWRFEPDENNARSITFIHSSERGVVTLFSLGRGSHNQEDTIIWQIYGETGELLRTCRYPCRDGVEQMTYVESMNAFLLSRRSSNELIILNEFLEEERCIKEYNGDYNFGLSGNILWEADWTNGKHVSFRNLQSGEFRRVSFEVPAYPELILPDKCILGVNEKGNRLIVFDENGIVIARASVPGCICRAYLENGQVYIMERRGSETYGAVYSDLFDEISTHIWRMDPVASDGDNNSTS